MEGLEFQKISALDCGCEILLEYLALILETSVWILAHFRVIFEYFSSLLALRTSILENRKYISTFFNILEDSSGF